MVVTGKIIFIDPTKNSSKIEGKEFLTRSFAIDASFEANGIQVENYMALQSENDNCKKLDTINVGDTVNVTYAVRGMKPKKKEGLAATEKNPEGLVCYSNLSAYGFEVVTPANTTSNPAQAQSAASTPSFNPAAGAQTKEDLPF
jgi:hypothetical protein